LWSGMAKSIVRFCARIKRISAQPARLTSSALYTVQKGNAFGCVAKFFEIRDNARFLAIEKPND
jgi:hypothetical protein